MFGKIYSSLLFKKKKRKIKELMKGGEIQKKSKQSLWE
jgi:hypothetical protein